MRVNWQKCCYESWTPSGIFIVPSSEWQQCHDKNPSSQHIKKKMNKKKFKNELCSWLVVSWGVPSPMSSHYKKKKVNKKLKKQKNINKKAISDD